MEALNRPLENQGHNP